MISRNFCLWKDSAAKCYSKTKNSSEGSVTEDSNNLISLQYYKALVCIRKHLNCLVRFFQKQPCGIHSIISTKRGRCSDQGSARANKPIAINASVHNVYLFSADR